MAKEPTAASVQTDGKSGAVTVRDRYVIQPASVIAELSTPTAQAFVAEDRRDPARQLFALIGPPELPPRLNVARSLKGVQSAGLLPLVEWGILYWPPAGRSCAAVIYERPAGGRVMASLTGEMRRIDSYDISRAVIAPLVTAIRELTGRGISHRAIRPTNMFFMDPDRESIVFGDCVTAPPAFDQPVLFETIESGLSHPAARGSGDYGNDLYALGVSLVVMMLGRNPVAHYDDHSLIKAKITQGSYATLVGEERLPLSMIEVLRGLLCDDPNDRWTLEALDLWLSGRRLSPLQTKLEKRAQRSFPFNGKEYNSARELAIAFSRNWEQAVPPVLEGRLELWLRRALDEKEKANAVSAAVRNVASGVGDRRVTQDVMLARVCMILDPAAPIRYKGFHAMPEGFGSALAVLMGQKGDPRLFAECILREVPKLWFESRGNYNPDHSMTESSFRDLKLYLQQTTMGNGLERCLYELNESLPCQSPLVAEDYVVEAKDLLPALNNAAKRVDPKTWPIDRHIAAFITCRFRMDVEKQLAMMNEASPDRSVLGMVNLLAVMQWRLHPDPLYGLTAWLGGLLGPVIASYNSRERRHALEREIPKLVRQGSIIDLYKAIDNAEERQKDSEGFAWAQAEYAAADQEIQELDSGGGVRDEAAQRLGQQTAALTSAMIALLTITILVIVNLF